jgi:DNA-binding transcriptional ArsR family regulator
LEPAELETILASPGRRRILDLIRTRPGVSVSELARLAGMYWTSAAAHVEQLRQAGLVRAVRVGRRRVLFSSQILEAEAADAPGILGEPSCRRVAVAIAAHPRQRVWELCESTGMSERAVYHHVKRLVAAGLVATSKTGAYRGLEATPRLLACLSASSDVGHE